MSTIETWNKISNTGVKHKVRYKNETFMENSQVFLYSYTGGAPQVCYIS